ASSVYPSGNTGLGTIAGKVVNPDGSPVQSGLVSMVDTANGNALSALTKPDGTFSTAAPAGSYTVAVEALTASSIVQAGNLYLSTSTPVTGNFQPTIMGGVTTPGTIAVTAGNAATVPDLKVTTGAANLQVSYLGIGKAGGSGDIRSVLPYQGPMQIASGQSVDLGITGPSIDGTIGVQVIGQGISVHPGTLHVEPNVTFGTWPLVRVTLDITGRSTPTLASLYITRGSSIQALSGFFVIGPPTPTFTSAGVVNAASYTGAGIVSPGGISSIYDTANNSIGPTAPVSNTVFDAYGNLPATAGGVTVTFDGVPAPIFFAFAGQINLQVPFEVAGKTSTKVVVNYNGSQSAPVTLQVAQAQPAFFTLLADGKADSIAANFPDNTFNGAANPIAAGGYVTLYGTGIGNLYPLATGAQGIVPPTSYSSMATCSFAGKFANAYEYWVANLVGLASWTVQVPSSLPSGPVSVTCTDTRSGAPTQQGTVYVK
ncbi:MAG: hypothetical protein KGN84_15080, partial [Acidobacteriota bacterium]|nr:hypothetical protein [Acidobacteriota bacterium]